MEAPKYQVRVIAGSIRQLGKIYKVGDTLELSKDDYRKLKKIVEIVQVEKKSSSDKEKTSKKVEKKVEEITTPLPESEDQELIN